MKRKSFLTICVLILAVILIGALVACGGNPVDNGRTDPYKPPVVIPSVEDFPIKGVPALTKYEDNKYINVADTFSTYLAEDVTKAENILEGFIDREVGEDLKEDIEPHEIILALGRAGIDKVKMPKIVYYICAESVTPPTARTYTSGYTQTTKNCYELYEKIQKMEDGEELDDYQYETEVELGDKLFAAGLSGDEFGRMVYEISCYMVDEMYNEYTDYKTENPEAQNTETFVKYLKKVKEKQEWLTFSQTFVTADCEHREGIEDSTLTQTRVNKTQSVVYYGFEYDMYYNNYVVLISKEYVYLKDYQDNDEWRHDWEKTKTAFNNAEWCYYMGYGYMKVCDSVKVDVTDVLEGMYSVNSVSRVVERFYYGKAVQNASELNYYDVVYMQDLGSKYYMPSMMIIADKAFEYYKKDNYSQLKELFDAEEARYQAEKALNDSGYEIPDFDTVKRNGGYENDDDAQAEFDRKCAEPKYDDYFTAEYREYIIGLRDMYNIVDQIGSEDVKVRVNATTMTDFMKGMIYLYCADVPLGGNNISEYIEVTDERGITELEEEYRKTQDSNPDDSATLSGINATMTPLKNAIGYKVDTEIKNANAISWPGLLKEVSGGISRDWTKEIDPDTEAKYIPSKYLDGLENYLLPYDSATEEFNGVSGQNLTIANFGNNHMTVLEWFFNEYIEKYAKTFMKDDVEVTLTVEIEKSFQALDANSNIKEYKTMLYPSVIEGVNINDFAYLCDTEVVYDGDVRKVVALVNGEVVFLDSDDIKTGASILYTSKPYSYGYADEDNKPATHEFGGSGVVMSKFTELAISSRFLIINTAPAGYEISGITINGKTLEPNGDGDYLFHISADGADIVVKYTQVSVFEFDYNFTEATEPTLNPACEVSVVKEASSSPAVVEVKDNKAEIAYNTSDVTVTFKAIEGYKVVAYANGQLLELINVYDTDEVTVLGHRYTFNKVPYKDVKFDVYYLTEEEVLYTANIKGFTADIPAVPEDTSTNPPTPAVPAVPGTHVYLLLETLETTEYSFDGKNYMICLDNNGRFIGKYTDTYKILIPNQDVSGTLNDKAYTTVFTVDDISIDIDTDTVKYYRIGNNEVEETTYDHTLPNTDDTTDNIVYIHRNITATSPASVVEISVEYDLIIAEE